MPAVSAQAAPAVGPSSAAAILARSGIATVVDENDRTPVIPVTPPVVDMPVTVAVDTEGNSVHTTGPAEWKDRIASSMELAGTAILGQ